MEWIAVAAVLGLGLMIRASMRRMSGPEGVPAPAGGAPFHCVAVQPCQWPCDTARRIGDRRFLPAEAPPLPLEPCALHATACIYLHFDDRRHHRRRDVLQADAPAGERRDGRGRRVTDRVS